MPTIKQSKSELRKAVLKQQELLNVLNEVHTVLQLKIKLLEEQNTMLWDYNFKLISEEKK